MIRIFLAVPLAAVLFLAAPLGAGAEESLSTQDIIQRLTPAGPDAPRARGLQLNVGTEAAEPAAEQPSISFQVEFEFDSAELTPRARAVMDRLGEALRSDELQGYRFRVTGHTDGVGAATYNQTLSERRAGSVRDYLMQRYGIPSQRLEVRGMGMHELLDPANPSAAVNRRVEVTNLGG